ncbi:MAG: hypothetical protein Q7U57_07750 [Methylovulum sp.]|nr:hypothetical protein [Methylovulum sp.]
MRCATVVELNGYGSAVFMDMAAASHSHYEPTGVVGREVADVLCRQ